MNSKQLLYFVSVAETGSFTAAAQKLGLSQPPLSKQIMSLEEELGVTLLKRGSRKAELTEEGVYLYNQARNILSIMDTTILELSHFQSAQNGTLRLGTISSSGYVLSEQILKDFCRRFPQIRFEIKEGNTYELLEQLKNGIIECAILRTPFNTEGFECIYGPEEYLTAVGDPSFFHCDENEPISLTDLIGIPLIQYRRFDSMLSVAFQNARITPSIFCHNDDARTCLLWASAGLGVALVPETLTRLPLTQNLAIHKISSHDTITRMAAVYKKNGYVSNIAKEFVSSFRSNVSRP